VLRFSDNSILMCGFRVSSADVFSEVHQRGSRFGGLGQLGGALFFGLHIPYSSFRCHGGW